MNRAGHTVTIFEREDRAGGLLRYGIPDFKLEKEIVERRVNLLKEEGITFKTSTAVGTEAYPADNLREFDAVVLCGGATEARDLPIPGRELEGIHFAMEFLPQQNKSVAGDKVNNQITATGKHVIVIGGGDTGSDCIGTSRRQGATSINNFELLPMPPKDRPEGQPWPFWPMRLRISTSHEEGCDRYFRRINKRIHWRKR